MRRSTPVVTLLVGSAMALAGLTALTPAALASGATRATTTSPTVYGNAARAQGEGPPVVDEDADGVPDSRDQCSHAEIIQRPSVVEADGCPPFVARVQLKVVGIRGLLSAPSTLQFAACYFNRGVPCRIKGTLTLSDASRRTLGLKKARISSFDESFPTSQKESRYGYKGQQKLDLGLSKSVEAKLKKAKSVTITLSATYTRGSEAPKRVGSETFTLSQTRLKGDRSSGNGFLGINNSP